MSLFSPTREYVPVPRGVWVDEAAMDAFVERVLDTAQQLASCTARSSGPGRIPCSNPNPHTTGHWFDRGDVPDRHDTEDAEVE